VLYFGGMSAVSQKKANFKSGRLAAYPVGLIIRAVLVSGREVDAQIVSIETTTLGTFLHIEFGQEAASVTFKQIVGFYDFCFVRRRKARSGR
jgi:hypothetical protein